MGHSRSLEAFNQRSCPLQQPLVMKTLVLCCVLLVASAAALPQKKEGEKKKEAEKPAAGAAAASNPNTRGLLGGGGFGLHGGAGGFGPGGRPHGGFGGFGPGGRPHGGRPHGGGFGGLGGFGGRPQTSTCRYWCKTPEGKNICCEENVEPPKNPLTALVTKPGFCPTVRNECPLRSGFGGPQTCSSDGSCV